MKYRIKVDSSLSSRVSTLSPYPYQIEYKSWVGFIPFWTKLVGGGFDTLIEARVGLRLRKKQRAEVYYYYDV